MQTLRGLTLRIAASLDDFGENWLGWTFPPPQRAIADTGWRRDDPNSYCGRCGDSVGPGESDGTGCATCRHGAELSGGIADGVVRLGPYIDPLRQWLHMLKFGRWTEMGESLGTMLGERLLEGQWVQPEQTVVIPVPSPWQRRLYRGIDHTGVLAGAVARVMDTAVVRVLARDMGIPQVKMTASERKRAGARGLRVRRRLGRWNWLHGAHVILVDDVRTTGATLKAAVRLLRRLQPERIVCAVAAVSDNAARQVRRNFGGNDESKPDQSATGSPSG